MNLSESTLFAEDFLARTYRRPHGTVTATSMETDPASGESSPGSSASWDPDTLSWRTSQLCLDGDLAEFSETFPTSGSMRNGRLFPLAPWVPDTHGSECSSWPTPVASDWRGSTGEGCRRGSLAEAVMLRPGKSPPLAQRTGYPSPPFVEWLMGFPPGWSDCPPSGTPSSPPPLSSSSAVSSKRKG